MATVTTWRNVAVAMQSALGTAKTITAISKAAPGVVTATHDFTNGDYIVLTVNGMYQLNDKVYRVCAVSTTVSFGLEDVSTGVGIDTTSFDTFSSGTCQKITFGTSLTTITSITPPSGDIPQIDTTTIHASQKTSVPGTPEALVYGFESLWDVADAGQIALKSASDSQAKRAFKVTFGTGGKIMVLNGYIGFIGAPGGNAQDKVTCNGSINASATPTYYAS